MRYLAIVLICLLSCALHAAQAGALFNPKISSRTIALNQPVRVSFTTIPAQLPEVDIASTVRSALALPDARSQWRLFGDPTVQVHERLKTIEVGFVLLPRQSGTLSLPAIPVRWLEGDKQARFGDIAVAEAIAIGSEERPVPLETQAVAGVPWTAHSDVLRQHFGEPQVLAEKPIERLLFTPQPGLRIETRAERMALVSIDTPELSLDDTRHEFVERWGEPIRDRIGQGIDTPGEAAVIWHLGWLRISGYDLPNGGIRIELLREDVAADILASHVERTVFDLLEGKSSENTEDTTDSERK